MTGAEIMLWTVSGGDLTGAEITSGKGKLGYNMKVKLNT